MGEIADAIRRARGQGSGADEFPRLGGAEAAPAAMEPAHDPPEFSTSQGRWVETLDPNNPAVAPEEGAHAEVSRHIALRLREELEARQSRSVVVVSAERGDGKTTVACNLAVAMASLSRGRSVALVDLDLRKPSIAEYLTLSPDLGIEQVLLGKAGLEEVQISVRHPAIDVYPAVTPQRAAHELIVLPKLAEIVVRLERQYSMVIIDTPPAPVVPDANLVMRHAGCAVPVVRKGKTRMRTFRRMLDCISSSQIAGWVVNCDSGADFREYDYYYYGSSSEPTPAARSRGWLGALGLDRPGWGRRP